MDISTKRSAFVDGLISDYGADVGIADLAFDAENMLALRIDGIDLTLLCPGKPAGIVVKTLLETEENLAPLAGPLAALNLRSLEAGVGIVGFDEDMGSWVWMNRFDPNGMTVVELHTALIEAVGHVRFWAEQLALLHGADAGGPTDSFDDSFIRV